jgi:Rnl2 family RNA ligase
LSFIIQNTTKIVLIIYVLLELYQTYLQKIIVETTINYQMEFIKYPSIDTNTKPTRSKNSTDKWVATEKIHGSNLSIYLDLANIGADGWLKTAKRTGFMTPEDKVQFPCDEWLAHNKDNLEQTARNTVAYLAMLGTNPSTAGTYLVIFGEFYGGWFPTNPSCWQGSKSLPTELKAYAEAHDGARPRPVQWDIYYSTQHEFVCFDMVVIDPAHKPVDETGKPVLASEVVRYQNWLPSEFIRVQPIPQVPLMFSGTLAECGEFANSKAKYVNSAIPELLHGLPALAPGTNIIEGVVVSPASGPHFSYKIKNKAFQETVKTAHVPKKERGQLAGHPFLGYITRNRWNAVRSKYGVISADELKAAFVADALEEYTADNPDSKPVSLDDKYIETALNKFYTELDG